MTSQDSDSDTQLKTSATSQKRAHKELNSSTEMHFTDPRGYKIQKISKMARLIDEYTTLSKQKNLIWSTTECDITEARQKIKAYKDRTGESISFTAFLITVFARVVANHKNPMNAIRKKKKELYIFEDVDVLTNIERKLPDGTKKPVNYTIRKAQTKTLKEISAELREAQKSKEISATSGKQSSLMKKISKNIHKFPKFIRKIILNFLFSSPTFKKNSMGTVGVTAVGMFGSGLGHMIHLTPHTISLGVGGMDVLPFNVNGEIVNRDLIALTIAMDHAIIDGAPAARFFHDLRQMIMYFCHDAEWCFKSLE
ncbi:2-oxo acid dehydrogenase subunit E2 [Candidatus Lokiarchaeum ossiferum]|uniref:2-oxo acid dehydrogenase subunit E2 n=1 Tax=Candidatus Lokiarchaeum ossiferum TaxID=2951803 RepID=UPI00352D9E5B